MAEQLVKQLVEAMGAPVEELNEDWVRYLGVANGLVYCTTLVPQIYDKIRNDTRLPNGERKVASFAVMNFKYVGLKKLFLATHILSGLTSVVGSTAALFWEQRDPKKARSFAYTASLAEGFFHGPSAVLLSPSVYGDKGVAPIVYGITSGLLWLSGLRAYYEAQDEPSKDNKLTELRRMNSTLSIFLYVRLYALMRGLDGILEPQKYTLAVMTAGAAMLPVGWKRKLFPAAFWIIMAYNYKTFLQSGDLVKKFGLDKAAAIQRVENLPKIGRS